MTYQCANYTIQCTQIIYSVDEPNYILGMCKKCLLQCDKCGDFHIDMCMRCSLPRLQKLDICEIKNCPNKKLGRNYCALHVKLFTNKCFICHSQMTNYEKILYGWYHCYYCSLDEYKYIRAISVDIINPYNNILISSEIAHLLWVLLACGLPRPIVRNIIRDAYRPSDKIAVQINDLEFVSIIKYKNIYINKNMPFNKLHDNYILNYINANFKKSDRHKYNFEYQINKNIIDKTSNYILQYNDTIHIVRIESFCEII